ncbi:MAG: hypothetical protein U5L09_10075 [Bacteroidales bacterium]|nr:hypothetical protein [Bacteroidales bacterium]
MTWRFDLGLSYNSLNSKITGDVTNKNSTIMPTVTASKHWISSICKENSMMRFRFLLQEFMQVMPSLILLIR